MGDDTNTLIAVDISYGTLTDDIAEALKRAGITVLGQCLWDGIKQPTKRITNLRTALNHGLSIYGYTSVTSADTGDYHAAMGRDGVPDDIWVALLLDAIDVELPGITSPTIRSAVDYVYGRGKSRCIYASYASWKRIGDPQSFGDCLLIDANWDEQADLIYPRPYGIWTPATVIGKQYFGDATFNGLAVDFDIFNRALLIGDSDMTPEQVDAAIEAKLNTEVYPKIGALYANAGSLGAQLIQQGNGINAVGSALIQHVATHPGGGATNTMAADLDAMQTAMAGIEAEVTGLKGKIAAIGAAANGG